MKNTLILGHILAIFTIFVWGSTFSSTKVLLKDFSASEILFMRFFIAYILLFILHYKGVRFRNFRLESLFICAGLCGGCLYFLLENIALNYTSASNASLLVAINPIFTALLSFFIFKQSLKKYFFIGSFLAFIGILFVVFQGQSVQISPFGDMLCIIAGFVWSVYTLLLERIFYHFSGENSLAITRKIFFYGLCFTLPIAFFSFCNNHTNLHDFMLKLSESTNAFNLLFLGIFASAMCYLTWNKSLQFLGTLKASAYIYAIPVIGVFVAMITLGESLNFYLVIGGILTLLGLFLSQKG